MSVRPVDPRELRQRTGDGLIIRGCGGPLSEWVDGINGLLTEAGILQNGTRFTDCETFEHRGLTCLLFPFTDDVQCDMGRLAVWRLRTHENFGGTWLSDFVTNELGGYLTETEDASESCDEVSDMNDA